MVNRSSPHSTTDNWNVSDSIIWSNIISLVSIWWPYNKAFEAGQRHNEAIKHTDGLAGMPYGIRGSANGHQKCDLRMISRDLTVGKEATSTISTAKKMSFCRTMVNDRCFGLQRSTKTRQNHRYKSKYGNDAPKRRKSEDKIIKTPHNVRSHQHAPRFLWGVAVAHPDVPHQRATK